MMIQVGNMIINICSSFFAWLTTNQIGAMFMFLIMLALFEVFYTLGGKNK